MVQREIRVTCLERFGALLTESLVDDRLHHLHNSDRLLRLSSVLAGTSRVPIPHQQR
jgi:hypothetical protein